MSGTKQCLPPEWARQSAVMLTWPHSHGDWALLLNTVEPVFAAIAREVTKRQRLIVACYDAAHLVDVRARLREAGADLDRTGLYIVPSNDTWARDHGPITVIHDARPRLLNFRFNGWGGKYIHDLDDAISSRLRDLAAFGDTPMDDIDLVLEGGSIETDGEGTLLTTEECLLSERRNPRLSRSDLTNALAEQFGTPRVLWLRHGHLMGDDTDGHIDTLARFCDPHTIAYVACDDPNDPHYASLAQMAEELQAFTDYQGQPYRLVPLPLPAPCHDETGKRLPATYANFLIINGAVLVPTYDGPADQIALERLADCFVDREVVPIDCRPLIAQYGSLHCVTMQLPEGVV